MIHPCKNAFLCDTETSGDHCKLQKRIRLERFAHDRTDHIQHLTVIAVFAGLCKGNVILVDQKDHRLFIIGMQHPGQDEQAVPDLCLRCFPGFQPCEAGLIFQIGLLAIQQVGMFYTQAGKLELQLFVGILKIVICHVLEGNGKYRTLVHPFRA